MNNNPTNSSPGGNIMEKSTTGRGHRNKFPFVKEGTEVGKTLSFEPDQILHQRRLMCARRGELGSEKVICHGKSVMDEEDTTRYSSHGTTATVFSSSRGRNNNDQQVTLTGEDSLFNQNYAMLNSVDAPSPLNRLFSSPIAKQNHHSPGNTKNDNKSPKKSGTDSSPSSTKGQDDLFAEDEADEEGEEEEEEEMDEIDLQTMALPDWRVLLGKELYNKEKDETEIIKERYSVATNPQPGRGRRRQSSVASASMLAASTRK